MKKGAKITINGTVQGVFFRNFVKENAEKLELKGFVRNLEDKNVEIIVEGEGDNIKELIELVKKGPPHSQIRSVDVKEKSWSGELKEFKILRI